jgi:hypothetical protein
VKRLQRLVLRRKLTEEYKMEKLDIWCPNDKCGEVFQYEVETENMGAGTQHDMDCPFCDKKVYFEIDYKPVVGDERLKP